MVDILEGADSYYKGEIICMSSVICVQTWCCGADSLRTADEAVPPVPAHGLSHGADDLPLLFGVRGLLGDAQLGDDRLAGLDGDAGAVNGTAGDCV